MKDRSTKSYQIVKKFREDGNLAEILQSIELEFKSKAPKIPNRFTLDPLQAGSEVPSAIQSRSSSPRVSYLDIASGLNHAVETSGFKLRLCEDTINIDDAEQKETVIPAK